MDESIIIIDSEDEDCPKKEAKSKIQSEATIQNGKRHNEISNDIESPPVKLRRIQPLKIGEVTKIETSSSQESDLQHKESSCSISSTITVDSERNKNDSNTDTKKEKHRNEVTKELEGLINACRKAENNSDMKKIIKTKLMKYYDLVHPDYAKSDHLCKMLENTALGILRDPKSVYSKLQEIINELKSRKNCGPIVVEQTVETVHSEENGSEEIQSTGDEKKDKQLKKLNKALAKLKNAIEDLEEAEVNLDDDDESAYMKKVKYEKRAVEIYNKICAITGESSHAHRIGKQPIKFRSTKYQEFNRRLSKRINKENGFPSFYDVYRLLDVCNKEYNYGLLKEEVQNTSQLAFVEVGKLLKERRCNDLYESAEHYAGKNKDPAKEDPELKAKLEKNKEFYVKKTEEIMQLFVTKQLNGEDEREEMCEASTSKISDDSLNTSLVDNENDTIKSELDEVMDTSRDIRSMPTEKIMIDIKTECDIKQEETKDGPAIDIAISL